jgi:hypothetical protein
VPALYPDRQHWTEEVRQIRGDAHRAVRQAATAGQDALDPRLLAELRDRYGAAVHWGEITNRLRDWDDGKNHPGYVLVRRLKPKPTRSGYSPATSPCPARYWRVRSYLATSRNNGIRPIAAIRVALAGKPWLPASVTA